MDNQLTIAETFVGCGGSHLGFKKAGYKTIFVNDIWKDALDTLKNNDLDLKEEQILLKDIRELSVNNIPTDLNGRLDVLMGGVVCKGFSLAGIRNPLDERNYLYLEQLRLVKELNPKISIIENVPAMLSMKILKREETSSEICKELNQICENIKHKRAEIIKYSKKDMNEKIDELKKDLIVLNEKRKTLDEQLEKYKYNVVEDIEKIYKEIGYTTYKKVLMCSEYNCFTNRKRLFIVAVRNDIQKKWVFPEPTTKDKEPNVKDAFELLDLNGINNPIIDKDNIPMKHNSKTIEKFKKISSQKSQNTDSYFSRGTSSRLDYDKPAPTLVPGHSSFQIHPTEHRSITVREGALITGFPNTYKFSGNHTSRCMQIGNAIPVDMAFHLALQCKKFLSN